MKSFYINVFGIVALTFVFSACSGNNTSNSTESEPSTDTISTGSGIELPSHFSLVWQDEFDGEEQSAPNAARWAYDLGSPLLGGSVWGNNENQHYTNERTTSYISSGSLVIQAVNGAPAEASAGVFARSARIVSNTNDYYDAIGTLPYGYYEIRAKVSCIAGAWPAIWMLGRNGNWPARGEIDIMEWFGRYYADQPNQYSVAFHFTDRHGGNPLGSGNLPIENFCADYQVFHVLWSETRIELGINGNTSFAYDRPTDFTSANWPFQQPAHLLLNIAVGGNLGGTVDLNDLPDMTMYVDYVRVWQNDVDQSTQTETGSSPNQLFASQYEPTGNSNEPYYRSKEGGEIFGFSGGAFSYQTGLGQDNTVEQRQAYGLDFAHSSAISDDSFFGLAIKAPNNDSLDISDSDAIVLQIGNGSPRDGDGAINPSHRVISIFLNGAGEQNEVYEYPASCSYDLTINDSTRPAMGPPEGVNPYGIQTYQILLSHFQCDRGNLIDLKNGLREASLQIIGGKDSTASQVASRALLQFGFISFTGSLLVSSSATQAPYKIFATQSTINSESMVSTLEGGTITTFSEGDFSDYEWGFGDNFEQIANTIRQRQAYGYQLGHANPISSDSFFGLAINAPSSEQSMNITHLNTLIIQLGNGIESNTPSHAVFTLELNNGTVACEYDMTIANESRPGNSGAHAYGLRTYEVPLNLFTNCRNGSLVDITNGLRQVVVKVVSGTDQTADNSAGAITLIQAGFIGFK